MFSRKAGHIIASKPPAEGTIMSKLKRLLIPLLAGLAGSLFLTVVYFAIVSWAESLQHARDLFVEEIWLILPLVIGFGIQAALYTILKMKLFAPAASTGPSGALTGAGGASSTVAMVACCAHHVTDVLPILGLTAATAFLAEYQQAFRWIGVGITYAGILVMLAILFRERRRAFQRIQPVAETV